MGVDIVTFGCRLNAFESEVILREAERAGLTDTIVINSCAVTNEAVAQARQSIRRLKRERPQARIVVTGCAAQTQAAMFADMAEVDRVVGNDDKMRGEAWRDTRIGVRRDAGLRHRRQRKDRGRRHHGGHGDGAAFAGRLCKGPAAGVRAGAERLRSPLHLLHHPLWPRQFALGADGRGGRPGPRAGRARPRRDRADRGRPHQLRRRPAGRAETRPTDQTDFAACAGAEAAADFVDRLRSRSIAICST